MRFQAQRPYSQSSRRSVSRLPHSDSSVAFFPARFCPCPSKRKLRDDEDDGDGGETLASDNNNTEYDCSKPRLRSAQSMSSFHVKSFPVSRCLCSNVTSSREACFRYVAQRFVAIFLIDSFPSNSLPVWVYHHNYSMETISWRLSSTLDDFDSVLQQLSRQDGIHQHISAIFPVPGFDSVIRMRGASPVTGSPAVKEAITETSLQDRWNAIHQQVGNHGMEVLCEAVLPQATAVATGTFKTFLGLQTWLILVYASLATMVFATPSTTTVRAFTTEVLVETALETLSVFVSPQNFPAYTALNLLSSRKPRQRPS